MAAAVGKVKNSASRGPTSVDAIPYVFQIVMQIDREKKWRLRIRERISLARWITTNGYKYLWRRCAALILAGQLATTTWFCLLPQRQKRLVLTKVSCAFAASSRSLNLSSAL
jgi:hypothetical protein